MLLTFFFSFSLSRHRLFVLIVALKPCIHDCVFLETGHVYVFHVEEVNLRLVHVLSNQSSDLPLVRSLWFTDADTLVVASDDGKVGCVNVCVLIRVRKSVYTCVRLPPPFAPSSSRSSDSPPLFLFSCGRGALRNAKPRHHMRLPTRQHPTLPMSFHWSFFLLSVSVCSSPSS
jgi:hypothetical protein